MTELDLEVWESLVADHSEGLMNYARHLTKDHHDAEDLLQETLTKTFKEFSRFKQGTNFRAWSKLIMKNTFINQYHKKQRSRESLRKDFQLPDGSVHEQHSLEETNAASHTSQGLPSAEESFMSTISDPMILSALNTLKPDIAAVFYAIAIKDYSYKDAAELLDMPIGTIMSRMWRARKLLREALDDEYGQAA